MSAKDITSTNRNIITSYSQIALAAKEKGESQNARQYLNEPNLVSPGIILTEETNLENKGLFELQSSAPPVVPILAHTGPLSYSKKKESKIQVTRNSLMPKKQKTGDNLNLNEDENQETQVMPTEAKPLFRTSSQKMKIVPLQVATQEGSLQSIDEYTDNFKVKAVNLVNME